MLKLNSKNDANPVSKYEIHALNFFVIILASIEELNITLKRVKENVFTTNFVKVTSEDL